MAESASRAARSCAPNRNRSGPVDVPQQVVGLVADAKYNDVREVTPPIVYHAIPRTTAR